MTTEWILTFTILGLWFTYEVLLEVVKHFRHRRWLEKHRQHMRMWTAERADFEAWRQKTYVRGER